MFSAINLRGFRQDCCSTMAHESVHRCPQRRVCRYARVTVRPSTLKTHHEVACRNRHTFDAVGTWEHFSNGLHATLHGQRSATGILNRERLQIGSSAQALSLDPGRNLIGFTPQTNHQNRCKVRMTGISCQRSSQQTQALTLGVDRTTCPVGQRDDAIDIRVGCEGVREYVTTEPVGNRAGHGGGTVHRCQNTDVVARGHTAVRPNNAEKGRRRLCHHRFTGICCSDRSGVTLERAHRQIVNVNMLASPNRLRCEANDLAVTAHCFTHLDVAHRHFVTRRNESCNHQILVRKLIAGHQLTSRDDHVIKRVQTNSCWRCHCTTPG